MLFNIRREGRADLMLGCSVPTREECEHWFHYYTSNYPQFTFEIVETDYEGRLCGLPSGVYLVYRKNLP